MDKQLLASELMDIAALLEIAKGDRAKALLERVEEATDAALRAELQQRLDRNVGPDGLVAIEVWQRDCDCVEGTTLSRIKPTVEAYEALVDDVEAGAEGPYSVAVLTPAQAASWQSYERDRAMEAFENGRGANAWTV